MKNFWKYATLVFGISCVSMCGVGVIKTEYGSKQQETKQEIKIIQADPNEEAYDVVNVLKNYWAPKQELLDDFGMSKCFEKVQGYDLTYKCFRDTLKKVEHEVSIIPQKSIAKFSCGQTLENKYRNYIFNVRDRFKASEKYFIDNEKKLRLKLKKSHLDYLELPSENYLAPNGQDYLCTSEIFGCRHTDQFCGDNKIAYALDIDIYNPGPNKDVLPLYVRKTCKVIVPGDFIPKCD